MKPPTEHVIDIPSMRGLVTDAYQRRLSSRLANATGARASVSLLGHDHLRITLSNPDDENRAFWTGTVKLGARLLVTQPYPAIQVLGGPESQPPDQRHTAEVVQNLEARVKTLESSVIRLILSPPEAQDGLVPKEDFDQETYRLDQILAEQNKHLHTLSQKVAALTKRVDAREAYDLTEALDAMQPFIDADPALREYTQGSVATLRAYARRLRGGKEED